MESLKVTLSAYADGVTLAVRPIDDIKKVQNIIGTYGWAKGLILNTAEFKVEWNKSIDVMGIPYVSEIKSWLSHTEIMSRKQSAQTDLPTVATIQRLKHY